MLISTRRSFLKQLSAAGVVSVGSLPPQFLCRAAGAARVDSDTTGRILVLVQLEGGNDGLNTVVPFGDAEYAKCRPGIGIARQQVLELDAFHGLHPQLEGLKALYDDGLLGIVQGVGYPNPDRSHFRSMDIWHSAQPDSAVGDRGWIGAALDLTTPDDAAQVPALALGQARLPLALVGSQVNVPTVADLSTYRWNEGPGPVANREARRKALDRLLEAGSPGGELAFLRRTAKVAYQTAARLGQVAQEYRSAVPYPPNGLAQKLKLVAQMIASDVGTRIFFVSLGGFDTHSQQAAAHAVLLHQLGSALAAFYRDLKGHELHDRVMVVTFSEFGRRVKENASLGTDHGAASQMFVLTPVQGGIFGPHPSLTDLEDGDLKFHTDFRSVYATLLEKWLGIDSQPVLGATFPLLDFA